MTRPLRLRAGDVISVAEPDYMYGRGMLTMRLTAVPDERAQHPALEWVRLTGVCIRWDGSEGPEREAIVRVAALGAATVRRPT